MEKNLALEEEKEENALVREKGKFDSITLMDLASKLSEKESDDLRLVLVKYKTYRILERHQTVLVVQDYIQEFLNRLQKSNYSSTRFQLIVDDLKYGDVNGSDESKLSIEMKSMAFYLLCGLVHSLRKTMLVDVIENLPKDWFLSL
ncbi:hypothetical protein FEM48_Zijuj09G0199000 [Ziziphus jujuba var. spinosa]|uniref:Uncharacterized protein n=1 Tax=Ziziphus jujuba var. spinosa TaxID=714518 RepID=A0A978UV02_ZIZJJ|nr:hypothetical protein FEM48_Zijuj09G0199000 [Ziziphus jujuba var. spinosa]